MFVKDLDFGEKWQEVGQRLIPIEEEHIIEVAPKRRFKDWDFKTNLFAYEVKADRLAVNYGCRTMFIEYECNNEPSGISTTKADYWMYFMVKPNGYICYEVPVSILKEACKSAIRKVSGGDGMRSRGYIIDVGQFEEFKI